MRTLPRWLLLVLVLAGATLALCGQAPGQTTKKWKPPPPPYFDPGSINFGGAALQPGSVVLVVEGEKDIALSATVFDKDTLTTITGTSSKETLDVDKAMVNWSLSDNRAKLTKDRTETDIETLLTPPTLMAGEPSFSFTITATPDDDPKPIPEDERGPESSRDDPPNTDAKITITVKVIKSCPDTITQTGACDFRTFS